MVATRCHILTKKIHQIRFRLGLCLRPRWGSLQRSPRPSIAGLKGAYTSKEGEGRKGGEERVEKGRRREEGRRGEGRHRRGCSIRLNWVLIRPCAEVRDCPVLMRLTSDSTLNISVLTCAL